ncbi:MAG: glycine--tRNA ligase [Candidatus Thermoplasmatota archaeon]|nr:glycine--tRNA ligase [Candidatus Thermoplasmatota archaeon]MBU1941527.1 glycine--tRNA ligase [Candidatus Thermoplasmatota archaeon]
MPQDVYNKLMMLAKRRGFIYPSFEIYGGVAGFYDYGPLGSQLKHNIETIWRQFYLLKDSCVEIHTPTITLYEVLKASGHVEEFTDLTVECNKCKHAFKVEDLVKAGVSAEEAVQNGDVSCPDCGTTFTEAHPVNLMFSTYIGIGTGRPAFLRPETAQGIFTNFHLLYRYCREKLPFGVIQVGKGFRNEISPRQGTLRQREFAMAEAEVFFDPENKNHRNFPDVKDKILYLFDNEKEMKLSLKDAVDQGVINNQALAYYMYLTQDFLLTVGINPKKFRFRKHGGDELAHYARECWDAELLSERFGWVECVGIADRSAYDLTAHIDASHVDMYALRKFPTPKEITVKKVLPNMGKLGPLFKRKAGAIQKALEAMTTVPKHPLILTIDGQKISVPSECYEVVETIEKQVGERFVPHVIEPSYGIDRIIYFVLEHSFEEIQKKDEEYRVLHLDPRVAPLKVGVFPLISDERLVEQAMDIDRLLRDALLTTFYDEGGTIGRRYARMDEVGTPLCVTVDHQSLEDLTVTVRDRDSTEQDRVPVDTLIAYLKKRLG